MLRNWVVEEGSEGAFLGRERGRRGSDFVKKVGYENFISVIDSELRKKCKKSAVERAEVIAKVVFLQPLTERDRAATQRGERLATFIERMERCSKYSRKFFLRFASDKVGTDKKRKRLIRMESLILAQDERWRQA